MIGKGEIRKRMLQIRNSMTQEEIATGSLAIFNRLKELEEIRRASTLMVYLSFGSEVLTDGLIDWAWTEGKRIVVSRCRPESRELTPCLIGSLEEVEPGHYGIREPKAALLRPVPAGEIDVVLVPAVAFDRRGYRVGYGGGYYDRFLPEAPQAARIGVAFACQMVAEIPVVPFDVKVDCIVTEEGTIVPAGEKRGS